jgi:NAD(P)-dependent dehydrogenase (short-subunit alcohol dehydrogenase family)
MGGLTDKVAIVTGAGRGLGRSEAMLLARNGAKVVVNDPGVALDGSASSESPADLVVRAIEAEGGVAVASRADCASFDGAESLIDLAVNRFGRLDILVNSAGIVRDRMSFNMPAEDWDSVVRVQLTGTFAPSRFAAAHWRERSKAGESVSGRIINTTSEAGLLGTTGQANYMAAKAAVAALTITMARELERYGVTVNAISPRAKTRLSAVINGTDEADDPSDPMSPDNVAPLVAYLASDDASHISGQVLLIIGNHIEVWKGWHSVNGLDSPELWTIDGIGSALKELLAEVGSQPEPLPFETGEAAAKG